MVYLKSRSGFRYKLFLIGLIFGLLSEISIEASQPFLIARLLILLTALSTFVLPLRLSTPLLILLLLSNKDFGVGTIASIWNFEYSFINPSWFVFLLIIVQLWKMGKNLSFPYYLKFTSIWFLIVPALLFILGDELEYSPHFISDLKIPLLLISTTVLSFSFFKIYPQLKLPAFLLIINTLAGRLLIDMAFFISKKGPEILEGVSRVSIDSTKSTIVLMLFLGLLITIFKSKKVGLPLSICAFTLMLSYSTRMIWVDFTLGVFLIFFLLDRKQIIYFLSLTVIVAVAGTALTSLYNQPLATVAINRAQDITEGRPQGKLNVEVTNYNMVSRIDSIRYAEFENTLNTMFKRKSWLWGSGYGSFYTDEIVEFPVGLQSAFSNKELMESKFYKTHNFVSNSFFKYGIIGFVLLLLVWAYPLIRIRELVKVKGKKRIPMTTLLLLVVVLSAATLAMEMSWSGKGLIINGFIIGLIINYGQEQKVMESQT